MSKPQDATETTEPTNQEDIIKTDADLMKEAWQAAAEEDQSSIQDALQNAASPEPSPSGDEALVEQYQQQLADMKDQLLRSAAETENVRRRAQRDVEETRKYSIANFAKELVSVCDNLERAIDALPEDGKERSEAFNSLAQGVEMTQRELMNVLERFGMRKISPLGEPFDHNLHQAVVQLDDTEHPPGTVLQVLQPGYVIHDRLLRAAMVGVSKQSAAPDADNSLVNTEA